MTGRETPEDAARGDEAAEVDRLRAEVAALRSALGADGWRLRRLAELGVAQAKINHDLRNVMTSALMVADRLQGSGDPKVSRAGGVLVTAIERATALISATEAFAADPAPRLARSRFPLARLIAEAVDDVRAEHADLVFEIAAPDDLHLEADRAELSRAMGHLLRTAAKAQARRVAVEIEVGASAIGIVISDDGRPFRNSAAAVAFEPFSGAFRYGSTGLGFVIAREVAEAHGGAMTLRVADEDDDRTCIVLTLPT
jgi:signal transduction histidine kinase